MKAYEIKELNIEEIKQKLNDLEEELFNLKFRPVTKQLDNPLKLRIVRREIARIKTIINENKAGKIKLASSSDQTKEG